MANHQIVFFFVKKTVKKQKQNKANEHAKTKLYPPRKKAKKKRNKCEKTANKMRK